jgi:signal peptidase I
MKRNELKIYAVELFMIVILFFTLFAPSIITREIIAIVLTIYALIVGCLFKKKKIHSIYLKQVIILLFLMGVLYVTIFYSMGLFFGFTRSKITLSISSLIHYIIPTIVLIISSEIIRNKLLEQDLKLNILGKKINLSMGLCYIAMVLVDLVIYAGVYDLTNIDDFLTALGFVLFASMSCNLLYNYITVRFGSYGIIAFRAVTSLFGFIIPFAPDVYLFFRTFLRIIFPYIIYVIFEKSYSKRGFEIAYKDKTRTLVETTVVLVAVTLLVALVSNKFTYGILVIGSESMTGTINIGDAVIFRSDKNDRIKKGDIVIFEKNSIKTVHRVVEISNFNGQVRYYTKGDSNATVDEGFITRKDITGIVKFKIQYLGYPTLLVRNLFE